MKFLKLLFPILVLFSQNIDTLYANELNKISNGNINWLQINDNVKLSESDFFSKYSKDIGINESITLELEREYRDKYGYLVKQYGFNYQDVPIEHARYSTYSKNGKLIKAIGKFPKDVQLQLSANNYQENAKNIAKNIKTYLQEKDSTTNFKSPSFLEELEFNYITNVVYSNSQFQVNDLAYCYKIEVKHPNFLFNENFYIDIRTNLVINKIPNIISCGVVGIANTLNNGSQNINTTYNTATYLLEDCTNKAKTFDAQEVLCTSGSGIDCPENSIYSDLDNIWDDANNSHIHEAHWGASKTIEYFANEHNLFGMTNDTELDTTKVFCNVGLNFNNAFYKPNTYNIHLGNGDGIKYSPLVSLDILAHEFTHGVTNYASNLIYQSESGALNESFSDIFGECIQQLKTNVPEGEKWLVGEQVTIESLALRSMRDPQESNLSSGSNYPKYYGGNHWSSGNSVHFNSAIQNYWFYLLTNIVSGTNEVGESFNLTNPFPINEALEIVFRMNQTLFPTATYLDSREASIFAFFDIYTSSNTLCQERLDYLKLCWSLVGVGDYDPNGNPLILNLKLNNQPKLEYYNSSGGLIEDKVICSLTESFIPNITVTNTACLSFNGTFKIRVQNYYGTIIEDRIVNFNTGNSITFDLNPIEDFGKNDITISLIEIQNTLPNTFSASSNIVFSYKRYRKVEINQIIDFGDQSLLDIANEEHILNSYSDNIIFGKYYYSMILNFDGKNFLTSYANYENNLVEFFEDGAKDDESNFRFCFQNSNLGSTKLLKFKYRYQNENFNNINHIGFSVLINDQPIYTNIFSNTSQISNTIEVLIPLVGYANAGDFEVKFVSAKDDLHISESQVWFTDIQIIENNNNEIQPECNIPYFNQGLNDFSVDIRNNGNNNLTNCILSLEKNNVVIFTQFLTGLNVPTNGTYNYIVQDIDVQVNDVIKIITSTPNGTQDAFLPNDTLILNVPHCIEPLEGNYLIGGAGAQYSTLQNAFNDIMCRGIKGDVSLEINTNFLTTEASLDWYPNYNHSQLSINGNNYGINTTNNAESVISIRNSEKIEIKDLSIANQNGFAFDNIDGLKLENINFINLFNNLDYGININNSNDIIINNIDISNYNYGILASNSQTLNISNCDFKNCSNSAVSLLTTPSEILDNNFNSCDTSITLVGSFNCHVNKNMISKGKKIGIYSKLSQTYLENNIISDVTQLANPTFFGMFFKNPYGIYVKYNTIINNHDKGGACIYIDNQFPFLYNVEYLEGNILHTNNTGVYTLIKNVAEYYYAQQIINNNFYAPNTPNHISLDGGTTYINNYTPDPANYYLPSDVDNTTGRLNITSPLIDLVNPLSFSSILYAPIDDFEDDIRTDLKDIGADEFVQNVSCANPITFRIYLEGIYNSSTGLMNTTLNPLISNLQPFNNTPWNYNGNESLISVSSNMVDWVLVEARSFDKCTVLARKAAILRNDGYILNSDGTCALNFNGLPSGSYYFVIRHRNHLDVMTNNQINYPLNSVYDFSASQDKAYSGIQKLVDSKAMLYAGDIDANGIINFADYNVLATQLGAMNQYLKSDINLDGNVTTNDYNLYNPNVSVIGPIEIRLSNNPTDCGYFSPLLPPTSPVIYDEWIIPSKLNDGKIYISVKGGSGRYSYNWYLVNTNGILSKIIYRTEDVINLAAGKYKVDVLDSKGQKASKEFIVPQIKSAQKEMESNNSYKINIYPNPASDILNVDIKSLEEVESISIISISGIEILKVNISDSHNEIDISNISSGIYFINIINSNKSIINSSKVVIYK
jgi:Zn-dependent metalloprotease